MFSLHKLQKFLLKHIFLVSSISQINRLLFLFLLIASPCSDCITNKYKCICKRGKSFQETFYFYFLWVNNASTSFFTHFHSINFIYTAYFAKNYFIFTSYMKYFCLWSISIVTALYSFFLLLKIFQTLSNIKYMSVLTSDNTDAS